MKRIFIWTVVLFSASATAAYATLAAIQIASVALALWAAVGAAYSLHRRAPEPVSDPYSDAILADIQRIVQADMDDAADRMELRIREALSGSRKTG